MKIMNWVKKTFTASVACLFASSLPALEKKDIPYYEKDARKQGNLEYLDKCCVLDIKIPDGKKGFPTLVWFHGGGFTQGFKKYPPGIDESKIAIVIAEYRLSGEKAKCPDYIFDAAAATAWTLKHIHKYGGDPKQVYVAGHSAGGYLSAMIALAPEYLRAFDADPMQLAAVLPISGQMTTHFQILKERRSKNPETPNILLDEYAPIARASKHIPPLILMAGDSNAEIPARVEENLLLAARLRQEFGNKNVSCFSFKTFNHNTVIIPGMAAINNYIQNRMKGRK